MYVCTYVHMYVCYMCGMYMGTYVCILHVCSTSKDAKEGVRCPGARVIIVMSHYTSWESNLGPLQEQTMYLTAYQCLQPLVSYLMLITLMYIGF